MKRATRTRPTADPTAWPWLVEESVDPDAVFLRVAVDPASRGLLAVADELRRVHTDDQALIAAETPVDDALHARRRRQEATT